MSGTGTYMVRAVRWRGGWELHIDGEGVTQCRLLAHAGEQVEDYLETLHGRSFKDARVTVAVDLSGVEKEIEAVNAETQEAAAAQLAAGQHRRRLAHKLRDEGLSLSDIASVLDVSRARVSQMLKEQVPVGAGCS